MGTLAIASRCLTLLAALLIAAPFFLGGDSATAKGFNVGLDKNRPKDINTPDKRKKYTQLTPSGIRKFNKGLSTLCPCLLIYAVPKGKNKGAVYVRDPRNADDMTKDEKKAFPKKLRDRKAKDLCDCYKKYRIGCNLIWELSQSKKDINLWRSKTQKGNSGESRHLRGNVAWNFKNSLSPPLHIGGKVKKPPHAPVEAMLGHELAHAYMWMKAGYPTRKRTQAEEIDASHAENQIRAEQARAEQDKNRTNRVRVVRLSPRAEYDYDGTPLDIKGTKEIITSADLLKCDKKKKVALRSPEGEPIEPEPAGRGTSYAIATQVPEVCVGTTYTVTEGTILEEEIPLVTEDDEEDPRDVPVEEVPVASVPEDGEDPKDVPNVPLVPAPEDGEDPKDVPQEDTPQADVPVVPVPNEGDDPKDVPQQDVPVSSTPEDEDEPRDSSIDLGLVKAEQAIVELALTDRASGEPVTDVAVKILADEPPLPGAETTDIAFDADSFFEDDVDGGYSGDDGSVQLASSSGPAAAKEASPKRGTAPKATPSNGDPALKVPVNREPRAQLVVSVTDAAPESAALSDAEANPGIAPFVTNAFSIGDQPFLVLAAPRSEMPALKTRIQNETTVSWFEPDPCRDKEEIDDPYFNEAGLWGQDFDDQWAVKRVGLTDEMLSGIVERTDASPVTVAVIDTGLDWHHPDLDGDAIWRNGGEIPDNGIDDDGNGYVDDVIGWNFVRHNNRPWDHDGHGTFVAGVIGAATNNGAGIAGINPHARIMPLKALDAFGRGHASSIAEAIAYAADNGAKVINLSLGGRGLTRIEKIAIDHANKAGALVVVAAGNDAADVAGHSPAGLDGVITVSATDRRDRRAGFSNWGEEVDISAPGVDVLSLRARKTDLLSYIRGVDYDVGAGVVGAGRAYYRASGTSFATPIVSGAASLLMSLRPELSAEDVRRVLLNSAADIETPGFDNYAGYGMLDVTAALEADPKYGIESRIRELKVASQGGKQVLRVFGTASADDFEDASISLGVGSDPEKWRTVKKRITEPVVDGVLMDIPAAALKGAKKWTVRLITRHKDGTERESRFTVTLG